eukprot:283569_1
MGNCCSKNEMRKRPDMDTVTKGMSCRRQHKRLNLSTTNFIDDYDKIDQKTKNIVFGYIYKNGQLPFSPDNSNYHIQPNIYYLVLKYYYVPNHIDALHTITALELSEFVSKKINSQTIDRLWKHMTDGKSHIGKNQIISALQFTGVLYVAFKYRKEGGHDQPEINKKIIKQQMKQVAEWMKNEKMNSKKIVHKNEYKAIFGQWLKEYDDKQRG